MAIFVCKRLRFQRNILLVVLGASLLLEACGGGGAAGGNLQTPTPAPVFTSTPVTAAAQGATYTYQIATTPATSVTLALVSAPTGATLSGNTLTWTPTAGQSRVLDQFSVKATDSAGNTTQSWSVTPTGTVSGTLVNTYWTPSGQTQVPLDWAPGFPSALVPQPDGSFQRVQGSGNADGTFSIPNVPGGYYWLQQSTFSLYWTSSSTFDFGTDINSKVPGGSSGFATTTLDVNPAGLDPLQAQDQVLFLPDVFSIFATTAFPASSPAGATTLSAGAMIFSGIDFSQIDMGFLMQYEPEAFGALSALKLGAEVGLSNLSLSSGVTNTIAGTLSHSPQSSFALSIKGSAWAPMVNNVGPGTPTLLGSDLSVTAQPFLNGNNVLATSGTNIPLLADLPTSTGGGFVGISGLACAAGSGTPSGSFPTPIPGEPAVTTDQDFGMLQYGDPFPSTWPRVFTFCQTVSVAVPVPDSTSPVAFQLVETQSTSLPTSQISPLIGPVQNPTINGSSLFVANTVAPTGVTLSWAAPSGLTPTGYKIATYVPFTFPGFPSIYTLTATYYTAKTSVTLQPIQTGPTCVFLITAVLDGRANFESSPNRSALPTAAASVISAPITISAGP